MVHFSGDWSAMWRGEAVDHLVLFWRESQEGEHIRRDMSELTPQGFSPNQEQKQNFLSMAPHGTTSQHCMWDTLCKTPCGLAWDLPPPVSDLDPSFTEPQTQMVLYFRKSRGYSSRVSGSSVLSCLVMSLHSCIKPQGLTVLISPLLYSSRLQDPGDIWN